MEDLEVEGKKPKKMKEMVISIKGGGPPIIEKMESSKKYKRPVTKLSKRLTPIWLIISVFLIVYCFNISVSLTIASVGQLFLGFGIIYIRYEKNIKPGIILTLISSIMCICGLLVYLGSQDVKIIMITMVIPVIVCSVFPIIGVSILILSFKRYILKKIRCTLPVLAQSTYVNKRKFGFGSPNSDSYNSVKYKYSVMWVSYFEYCYNGKSYYCDCVAISEKNKKPSLGETRKIFINPNKPEEYWSKLSDGVMMFYYLTTGLVTSVIGFVALSLLISYLPLNLG